MTTLLIPNRSDEAGLLSASHLLSSGMSRTVLAYHEVTPAESEYLYGVSSDTLESHLQLIGELGRSLDHERREPILSFDDGHISNYSTALPLLEKYRCKAIFFVIAGRISQRQDFMTWAHLRELISLGHRVEAHSWSHGFLTKCSDAELVVELQHAKRTIEDRLGAPVEFVSAPHGRWNARIAKACNEYGYRCLYTSNPWMKPGRVGGLDLIGRLVVRGSMSSIGMRRWLEMSRSEASVQHARYRLKQSARYILGNALYHRLWVWCSGWKGPDDTY